MSLLDVRLLGRHQKSAAGVVVEGQPDVVKHSYRGTGRERRSVRLLARADGVEADIAVEDVPALIEELREADEWARERGEQ